MKTVMTEIDAHLRTRFRAIIWKQWKVPSKRQWGLQKLGIGIDLARVTAYCGDRYYWVVTKICVVRAISKEVLAKAGLVILHADEIYSLYTPYFRQQAFSFAFYCKLYRRVV